MSYQGIEGWWCRLPPLAQKYIKHCPPSYINYHLYIDSPFLGKHFLIAVIWKYMHPTLLKFKVSHLGGTSYHLSHTGVHQILFSLYPVLTRYLLWPLTQGEQKASSAVVLNCMHPILVRFYRFKSRWHKLLPTTFRGTPDFIHLFPTFLTPHSKQACASNAVLLNSKHPTLLKCSFTARGGR